MEEDYLQTITEHTLTKINSRIIAVRHAESVANAQGVYQGQSYDTDLSKLGVRQAMALARRLSDTDIDLIIASPLKRTYQTALEIAKYKNMNVNVDLRIIETNHGVWEGKHKNYVQEEYPELYFLWQTDPGNVVFPSGEAFMDTVNRVEDFMQALPGNNIVVVTHDNIIRIMIALASNNGLSTFWKVPLESAAITLFEHNNSEGLKNIRLSAVNQVEHLEGLHTDINNQAL